MSIQTETYRSFPLFLLILLFLSGCLADFDNFQPVSDGGVPDDGSTADTNPDPINLGTPCGDPHLALVARSNGSSPGALLHYNVSDNPENGLVECQNTDYIRRQPAFGSDIDTVTGLPDGTEIVGLTDAIIGLDGRGFPSWRWQLFDESSGANWSEVLALRIADAWYLGLLRFSSYGPIDLVIVDQQGFLTTHVTELHHSLAAIMPHPDGSARIVTGNSYGDYRVFSLTETSTEIQGEGLVFQEGFDFKDVGSLYRIKADIRSNRMAATYENGVIIWEIDTPLPTFLYGCADCTSYKSAVIDPLNDQATYLICTIDGSYHLIWATQTQCILLFDGSTQTSTFLSDIDLIRGELR